MQHECVSYFAQKQVSYWVAFCRVESATHQNMVRFELSKNRENNCIKSVEVITISNRFLFGINISFLFLLQIPTDVHIEPFTFCFTSVLTGGLFDVGEETSIIETVERNVKHILARVKKFLSALSMVDIPIHNDSSLGFALFYQIVCSQAHIIEKREPMGL